MTRSHGTTAAGLEGSRDRIQRNKKELAFLLFGGPSSPSLKGGEAQQQGPASAASLVAKTPGQRQIFPVWVSRWSPALGGGGGAAGHFSGAPASVPPLATLWLWFASRYKEEVEGMDASPGPGADRRLQRPAASMTSGR